MLMIMNMQEFKNRIINTINEILSIRRIAEDFGYLDTQEYISFLDSLNKLSIDQDRPDSK